MNRLIPLYIVPTYIRDYNCLRHYATPLHLLHHDKSKISCPAIPKHPAEKAIPNAKAIIACNYIFKIKHCKSNCMRHIFRIKLAIPLHIPQPAAKAHDTSQRDMRLATRKPRCAVDTAAQKREAIR